MRRSSTAKPAGSVTRAAVALRHRDRGRPDRGGRARPRLRPHSRRPIRRRRSRSRRSARRASRPRRSPTCWCSAATSRRSPTASWIRRCRRCCARASPRCALANPISADLAEMRVSLWPGLVRALRREPAAAAAARAAVRARAQVPARRRQRCARCRSSPASPPGRRCRSSGAPRRADVDFFDVRADVEALLRATGAAGAFSFVPAEHPALHPGTVAHGSCATARRSAGSVACTPKSSGGSS